MERRDFIIKMGAIAGVAAAGSVPYDAFAGNLTPKMIKVKVYFLSHLADVQNVPDWPNIGYDFRPDMIEMVRKLKG